MAGLRIHRVVSRRSAAASSEADAGRLGLDVSGIEVSYGPVRALHGVSLRVDPGEMVALLGANGAGKTTTLRTISGLLSPKFGTISFGGDPIAGLPTHEVVERGIVHVPEGRDLFPTMSVLDNLRAGHWVRRADKRGFDTELARVIDYFPILGERRDQLAGTLSGGQQQMLGVARALMSRPTLLLIDELSFGLAPKIVEQLFEILRRINADGTSVLLVEQFVHLALANTDRAYVLAKGQVAAGGVSAELADDPALTAAYLGETVHDTAYLPAEPSERDRVN